MVWTVEAGSGIEPLYEDLQSRQGCFWVFPETAIRSLFQVSSSPILAHRLPSKSQLFSARLHQNYTGQRRASGIKWSAPVATPPVLRPLKIPSPQSRPLNPGLGRGTRRVPAREERVMAPTQWARR